MNIREQKTAAATVGRQGEVPKINLPPDERRCTAIGTDGMRCRAWVSVRVLRERGAQLCTGHARSAGMLPDASADGPSDAPGDAPTDAPSRGMPDALQDSRSGDSLAPGERLGRASRFLATRVDDFERAWDAILTSGDDADRIRLWKELRDEAAQERAAAQRHLPEWQELRSMTIPELVARLRELRAKGGSPPSW